MPDSQANQFASTISCASEADTPASADASEPQVVDRGGNSGQILRLDQIAALDRGHGVRTLPLIGKWNTDVNRVTTGITDFAPGSGVMQHSHNVDETVMILEGEARVDIDGELHALVAGDVTWVPADVPHRFENRGTENMRIYWVYGGRHVTRTLTATGETIEHLSERDQHTGSNATKDPIPTPHGE